MHTTTRSLTAYQILPQSHGWKLTCTDPAGGVTTFPSVGEAVQTACDLARERMPCQVRMYSVFGELVKEWYFDEETDVIGGGRPAAAAQR